MNVIIAILCIMAFIGLLDRITGNHLGLGTEFERGIQAYGSLILSCAGFYTIGVAAVQSNPYFFVRLAEKLPFDPSTIVGCLLSSDLGAQPIAQEIAAIRAIGIFSGCMIGSGLGMTLSCQFPVFLTFVEGETLRDVMLGFFCGIVTLPCGLIVSGLLLKIPLGMLLMNMIPVFAICLTLIVAFVVFPKQLLPVLTSLGKLVRTLSLLLFLFMIIGVFFPELSFVHEDLVRDILYISLRTVTIAGGGLVFSKILLKTCKSGFEWVARMAGVNPVSVIGFLLNCVSSLAMLTLLPKMDKKGVTLNAAFSVCGAYLLGGQLAFITSMEPGNVVTIFLLNKIISGICAVLLAGFLVSKRSKAGDRMSPGNSTQNEKEPAIMGI